MERCPNCRARYRGESPCPRCGLDLQPLLRLEAAADHHTARAVAALAAGDRDTARQALERARQQRDSAFLRALAGFLARGSGASAIAPNEPAIHHTARG
jgi:hypothetical protein